MSYYWFNKKDLLKKYIKSIMKKMERKAAKHYKQNKEAIKKPEKDKHSMLSKEDKEKKKEYVRNRYYKLKQQYKG